MTKSQAKRKAHAKHAAALGKERANASDIAASLSRAHAQTQLSRGVK